MENWGLVTYRTTAVLFDDKNSDSHYKKRVAYIVCHELAHQWFGNTVTMNWWNEVSRTQYKEMNSYSSTALVERRICHLGWMACRSPLISWYVVEDLVLSQTNCWVEWKSWSQFCSESLHSAFTLDSIRNSHPIEVEVKTALEVEQVFDHISYMKGSSVIRMLAAHLGTETFLSGVADYLKAYKYSNATTKNLWDALSEASKQDVNKFMEPWIRKIGFPVLTVTEQPGQISIKQSRFLISGDVEAKEDTTTWWVPLGIKTGDLTASMSTEFEIISQALTTKTDTISINDSFYKLNANMTGFYRTSYPAERLKLLGQARDRLSEEDRIGLVDDAAALAQSGDSTTAAFLSLIEGFSDETEYK
jgi:aminopeptidase N